MTRCSYGLVRNIFAYWLILTVFFAWEQDVHGATEQQWIALSNWAKTKNFKLTRPTKEAPFNLTNEHFRIVLKADSQRAEINGIVVWLSNPVTERSGRIYISSTDLNTCINPIVLPLKNNPNMKIQTICLDPGHGGKDTGGIVGDYREKLYTLLLSKELEKRLRSSGFTVILTRDSDRFVELDDRPAVANRAKADLFLSLHFDIAPAGQASGVEVYCLTPANASSTNAKGLGANTPSQPGNSFDAQNILFAYEIQKSLVNNLQTSDRGVRRARFAVLRPASMPAILIEGGFLSDPGERRKIGDPEYRAQLADAIVQGVLNYKHAVEP